MDSELLCWTTTSLHLVRRIFCFIDIINVTERLIFSIYDVIFTGGYSGKDKSTLREILQYNRARNTWEEVGQMKGASSDHALGVLADVSQLCP